jgi:phage shock protein PspC (stress-responsive transcriptional regulator)
MIAGVCGGLADYFDVDSSLIRLAVLFIFLFQGVGLIAYIIAWLIMSEEPIKNEYKMPDDYYIENTREEKQENFTSTSEKKSEEEYYQKYQKNNKSDSNRRKLFAFIMIIVGSIFLIDIWIPELYWEKYWPLILIAAGLLLLKGDNDDR